MNFIWKNFLSKAKITSDQLKEINIPLIDYSSFIYDNQNILALTGFGKFYKGKYNNNQITIKEVDITIDEEIKNEFILWKSFQENPYFLKIIGISLYYDKAFILFDDYFENTLESALNTNILSYKNKIYVTKQLLNILFSLKKENKLHMDLRPGTFSINSEYKIKIIDFGMIVNMDNLHNESKLRDIRIKYSSPEYILMKIMDLSYDIYSFGCILIDIFCDDVNQRVMNNKLSYDEYYNIIKNKEALLIPKNINCLLQGIISRCLTYNCDNRIQIDELKTNMDIILDYFENVDNINVDIGLLNNNNNNIKNDDKQKEKFEEIINNNDKLKEIYDYSSKLNYEISDVYKYINGDLQENTQNMKNDLLNNYENSLREMDNNYKLIKDKLDVIHNKNKHLIEDYYHKILNNILQMQNSLSVILNDLLDIQNQVNGIKMDIFTFSKFKNKDKYNNIFPYIDNIRKEVDKVIKKNSSKEDFDLIKILFKANLNTVNNYKTLTYDFISDLKDIFKKIDNIKGLVDNNLEEKLGDDLFIQKLINKINYTDEKNEFFYNINDNRDENDKDYNVENQIKDNEIKLNDDNQKEDDKNPEKINLIYAKIIENSDKIAIFNYFSKQIKTYSFNLDNINNNIDFKFNTNSYSLYDKRNNCIYTSGGLTDINDINSHSNSLLKLTINYIEENEDENRDDNKLKKINDYYHFELAILSSMTQARSSHCMLQLSKNNNILLSAGGINTNSCEVYNIEKNKWDQIQDIPISCPNPLIMDYNDSIFAFINIKEKNYIYKLNMKTDNNDFVWENMKYSSNGECLKKGMNVSIIENNIYLFGGYDDDNNNYSNVFFIDLSNDDCINFHSMNNFNLPKKCFYKSNSLIVHDNKIKEDIVIMNDNNNGITEYYYKNGYFKYYIE